MLIDTPAYTTAVEKSKYLSSMKTFLANRTDVCFEPDYFVTLYYGRSFNGNFLSPSEYRKRWDKTEVRKTHKFIRSLLRKCFPDIKMVFIMERHSETQHPIWGQMKGAFHTHLYLAGVEQYVHLAPDQLLMKKELRKLLPMFGSLNHYLNILRITDTPLIEHLLDECIRQAKWVGSHPDSLDIQSIGHNEFKRTFHYGLKQIDSEDDLNERIDWHHSDLI